MKKVINGRCYNTETATVIADHDNGLGANDFRWCSETLYRSRKNQWFILGSGGAMTRYSKSNGNTTWGTNDNLELLDNDQAQAWLEYHNKTDALLQHFDIEEG